MYVDASTSQQGKYKRYLLRENYRENGKVKHRTIANLSKCSEEEISAIRLALKHKKDLTKLASATEVVSLHQGLSVGAVWLVFDMARELGIVDALGNSREGKVALWQVIARVISQGSRLSAVRLAGSHAACDILGLDVFNEEDLYKNLDWLCEKQEAIEDRIFNSTHGKNKSVLFLYDVTSSYLEGQHNELGAFGYNRDGKKGKKQIVIGLLCDVDGRPISIEVFKGNTQDPGTMASQVRKVADRFGGGDVTFVGDRGMIKSNQVKDLVGHGFHYITAITKPQIEKLLQESVIQMDMFDQDLAEVETDGGVRYVLRRNPLRADEVGASRKSKIESVKKAAKSQNQYLKEHPRAKEEVALRKVCDRCKRLKISKWVIASVQEREITLSFDEEALAEASRLDGCYVLKTDLSKEYASKETIHARYKDLSLVEWAFRTSKTVELKMRPLFVRLASRTRGHALVVMLAYRIVNELAKRWVAIDLTVQEGISELSQLCATEMHVNGKPQCNRIPEPRDSIAKLLNAANVKLPEVLPCKGVKVATRKNLTKNRKHL
jgi:transposase